MSRALLLVVLAWACASRTTALRLPSWLHFLGSHGSAKRTAKSDDALWHDVLSQRSAHDGRVDRLDPTSTSGDSSSPSTGLRDPAVASVFSADAVKHLPGLAKAPIASLQPSTQIDQQHSAAEAGGKARTGVGAEDVPPDDLDVAVATDVGRLASIAYCSRPDLLEAWNCTRCAAMPSFQPHRVVYDAVWDLAGFVGYHAGWKAVVLSFRGTDSSNWGNWAENMRAWRTDHMYPVPNFPHALIHSGFYNLWTASVLQATMTQAVAELMAQHPGAQLIATGHSMGGALAQLAGLELKLTYNRTAASVYTFGAPRVGNLAYQQLFNQFMDVSWRFTHNRDVVPSVPLQLMGFHHVAREVWEVDVEDPSGSTSQRKLLMCDGTGEDPSCHNSACYLGLCTSIADHLTYLGLHMYQDSDEC